ncbi:MAG TPA: T9SS type A sorting domain-containing protein, partial [Aequorivita sp.]|nr:T9SS type A sorting domain-containing protein [Aequorivita sp.]
TILLLLAFNLGTSQDKIFIHTATVANSWDYVTYINHPDLNGSPEAVFMFNHCWGPSGFYNNKAQGIFYTGGEWAIFNEDLTNMQEGASFNIYIPNNPDAIFSHYAFPGNQGSFSNTTVIDHPDFNEEDPGPFAVANSIMDIGGTYSPKPFSFYYDTALNKRGIYINDESAMQEGFQYRIMNFNETEGATAYRHEVITGVNVFENYTYLDSPDLNGKPNAQFVFSQYWGVNGPSSEVEINTQMGAWYSSGEGLWSIYLEDDSMDMPNGAIFDIIIIPEDPLNITESQIATVTLFPNPTKEAITISANSNIEKVTIFNLLGQELSKIRGGKNRIEMNISHLKPGVYFAKVNAEGSQQILRFVKE